MYPTSTAREFRFGIGPPDHPHSSTWRIWVQTDSVYLMGRDFPQPIKISLHDTGWYWIAYVEGYLDPSKDREIDHWDRPDEYRPGWTRCIDLHIPFSGIDPRFPFIGDGSKVVWLPPAGSDEIWFFSVLLSSLSAVDDRATSGFPPTTSVLWRRQLRTLGTAWLIGGRLQLSAEDLAAVFGEEWTLTVRRGFDPTKQPTMALRYERSTDHPVLINYALGPANLRWEDD